MTPAQFAARCSDIVATSRGHEAHRALDLLTNDALRELGFGEGIAIFEAAVARWHAEADPYPYPHSCPDCDRDGTPRRREAAEGEACQPGPKASPNPLINHSNTPTETAA